MPSVIIYQKASCGMFRHIGTNTSKATHPIIRYKSNDRRGYLPSAMDLPIIPATTHAQRKPNNVHPTHPPMTERQISEYEPAIIT